MNRSPVCNRMIASIALILLFSVPVLSQTATYTVTENSFNYFINGDGPNPSLQLVKDSTYHFQGSGIPSIHPFTISTSSSSVNVPPGVSPGSITGNNVLTFTPATVGTFFYVCTVHFFFGQITVVNAPATSVGSDQDQTVQTYTLHANYPNPFNPATRIGFDIPERSDVRVTVMNVLGQEIATLHQGPLAAGTHHVDWTTDKPSGVYYYRLEAVSQISGKQFSSLRRMVLLK